MHRLHFAAGSFVELSEPGDQCGEVVLQASVSEGDGGRCYSAAETGETTAECVEQAGGEVDFGETNQFETSGDVEFNLRLRIEEGGVVATSVEGCIIGPAIVVYSAIEGEEGPGGTDWGENH